MDKATKQQEKKRSPLPPNLKSFIIPNKNNTKMKVEKTFLVTAQYSSSSSSITGTTKDRKRNHSWHMFP